jgi:hypothetical protein
MGTRGRQLVEQRLRLRRIARVEPFSEPTIHRSVKLASLAPLALMRHSRARLVAARTEAKEKLSNPLRSRVISFTINATDVLYSAMPQ